MPNEFKHYKKGLINIQNDDNKCFLWCHVRHLNLIDKNPQRTTQKDKEFVNNLNYEGTDFPISKKDYCKIETQIKFVSMFFVTKIKQLILFNYQAKNLMIVLIYC